MPIHLRVANHRSVKRRRHEARPCSRRASPRRRRPRLDELPHRLPVGNPVVNGHTNGHRAAAADVVISRPSDLHGEKRGREHAHLELRHELQERLNLVLVVAGEAAHVVDAAGVLGLDELDAGGDGIRRVVDDDVAGLGEVGQLPGEGQEDGEHGGEGGLQRADNGFERREAAAVVEEEPLDRCLGDLEVVQEGELNDVRRRRRPCASGGHLVGEDMGDGEDSH